MQGRGITNYSTNPSHAFTLQTTEFDDALLKRNIITFEQAMMAKGASPEEATRLAQLKYAHDTDGNHDNNAGQQSSTGSGTGTGRKIIGAGADSDEHDEAELREYRSKRLMQLRHGNVIPISRTEWNTEVNEASHAQWVVIVLTSTSSAPNRIPYHRDLCIKVEQDIIPHLAGKFSEIKWVSIPSKNAIENWKDDNLPTLFCYRGGKMHCQLVGLGDFGNVSADSLEFKLGRMGVLESDIDVDPETVDDPCNSRTMEQPSSYGRSKFKGGMATYATTNGEDSSDYDDVD
jgi:hypothetical protein